MRALGLLAPLLVAIGATTLMSHRTRRRVLTRLGTINAGSHLRAPAWLAARVEASDLPVDADRFVSLWTGALLVALMSIVVLGQVGLVLAALSVGGPIGLLVATRGRRTARRAAELVVFADAAASAVRGGASLPSAVAAAGASIRGPLANEVAGLSVRVDRGLPVADAFTAWTMDPDPDVRLTGRAFSMVAGHGGQTADALERTASVLRTRHDLRRERSGLATQARSSAVVMTTAPVAFAMVSGVTDPRTLHFLVATPVGLGCLVCGVALDLAGGRWMAAIVARAQ